MGAEYEGLPSFSTKIYELAQEFDRRISSVIESATGKTIEFHIGRIIESLLDCGLDFYVAVEVIQRIEPRLKPGMETKDISAAIIVELENRHRDLAREFRMKYDEGITLCLKDSKKVPLRMSEVSAITRDYVASMGYEWGGRRSIDEVTNSVISRCQKLGMPEIPANLLDQLLESELNERLGCTVYEYREEMPSMVAGTIECINGLINEGDSADNHERLLEPTCNLCKALLFYFCTIPPMDTSECMNTAVMLLDHARDLQHPLRAALAGFRPTIGANSDVERLFQSRKHPEDFVIEQTKSVLRRLSFFASKQSGTAPPHKNGGSESWDTTKTVIRFLAEFSTFLWPEDWLAASTLQQLRHDVLRNLFRYRCLDMIKLTRMLQVHPKHTIRALIQLQHEGLVVTHHLKDNELVLITIKGERHCEHNLGLKLRCSLSSL